MASSVEFISPVYNIAVFGDSGVGKSTYINRILTGNFTRYFAPSVGMIRYHYEHLMPNDYRFICNLIDTDGATRPYHVKYDGLNAAIIMFDVTSLESYYNVETWYNVIRKEHPDIPIMIVGNKVDISKEDRRVRMDDIRFHRAHNLAYCEVSAKSQYKLWKPIEIIATKVSSTI